jgi:hypothetical protein
MLLLAGKQKERCLAGEVRQKRMKVKGEEKGEARMEAARPLGLIAIASGPESRTTGTTAATAGAKRREPLQEIVGRIPGNGSNPTQPPRDPTLRPALNQDEERGQGSSNSRVVRRRGE